MSNFIMIVTMLMPHLTALSKSAEMPQEQATIVAEKQPVTLGMTRDQLVAVIKPSHVESGINFYSGNAFEKFYFEGGTCRLEFRSCVAELEGGKVVRIRDF